MADRIMIKLFSPQSIAAVYENGKMNIMGCTSIGDTVIAARKYADIVARCGYQVVISKQFQFVFVYLTFFSLDQVFTLENLKYDGNLSNALTHQCTRFCEPIRSSWI